MRDRLEVIKEALQQDGFSPETLSVLQLIFEELMYLRKETDRIGNSKSF